MWRRDGDREEEHEATKPSEAPAPAPVVSPGSLAWASAVGNQAVARMAADGSLARQEAEPEEESEAEPEVPAGAAAPRSRMSSMPFAEEHEAEAEAVEQSVEASGGPPAGTHEESEEELAKH